MNSTEYDALLVELFSTIEKYNTSMTTLQDSLYDCLYYNSEAERQAGFFAPQLNSSSFFNLSLSPHLRVAPTSISGDFKTLVIHSILPNSPFVEGDLGATKKDLKNEINPENNIEMGKRKQIQGRPEESSSDGDFDSDDEFTKTNKPIKSAKPQTLDELLKIFAVTPSSQLAAAQKEWIAFITERIPEYYRVKMELLAIIETIEEYKAKYKC